MYFQVSSFKIKHVPKREAERLRLWLVNLTKTARAKNVNIKFDFYTQKITAMFLNDNSQEIFNAQDIFTLKANINSTTYNARTGTITPGFTISISDIDDAKNYYHLKISGQGRIRITHENDDEE